MAKRLAPHFSLFRSWTETIKNEDEVNHTTPHHPIILWLASQIFINRMNVLASLWILVVACNVQQVSGFAPVWSHGVVGSPAKDFSGKGTHVCAKQHIPPPLTLVEKRRQSTQLNAALQPHDLPSLLTAFDTFDGSGIVDPVVVSSAFWTSLTTKIVSLLIGQLIATIVFTVVISIAASQISGVLDRVSKGIVERLLGPPPPRLRMPPPEQASKESGTGYTSFRQPIDLQKLAVCLAIDILGTSSEFLPIVGELTDVLYAPLAATLLRSLYGSNVVFLLEFGEEILPFTDVIPLATICWVVDTFAPASGLAKLLQLGDYGQRGTVESTRSNDVIVDATPRFLESERKRD